MVTEKTFMLDAPTSQRVSPPRQADYQSWFRNSVGQATWASELASKRIILAFTRSFDREVDEVSLSLARRGVGLLRVDADDVKAERMTLGHSANTLRLGEVELEVAGLWERYYDHEAHASSDGSTYGALQSRQRQDLLTEARGTYRESLINPRQSKDEPSKTLQNSVAAGLGLRVPRSITTSDPDAIRRWRDGHEKVIVKMTGRHYVEAKPGERTIVPPRILTSDVRVDLHSLPGLVFAQEYVEHDYELRIYCIGGDIHSFKVEGAREGGVLENPDDVRVSHEVLTCDQRELIRTLTDELGLTGLAAVDILVASGEWFFLEVNPAFDWLWYEQRAGVSSVTWTVTQYMERLTHG